MTTGLSKEYIVNDDDRTYSYVGTEEYIAPEIIKESKEGHSKAVDWWSLGVLAFELTTGMLI